MLTLVATEDGEIVGFASLKGDVAHRDAVRRSRPRADAASRPSLMDALTKLARARGAKKLTAEVSDTAKPLFDRLGFQSQKRNLVLTGRGMARQHLA